MNKFSEYLKKYSQARYTKNFGCWEFAIQFAEDYFGFHIQDFTEGTRTVKEAMQKALNSGWWQEIGLKESREGDFLLLDGGKMNRGIGHIGILISDRHFIHNRENTGVVIEPILRHIKRLRGVYRYVGD